MHLPFPANVVRILEGVWFAILAFVATAIVLGTVLLVWRPRCCTSREPTEVEVAEDDKEKRD